VKAERGDLDAINKLIGYYLQNAQEAEAQNGAIEETKSYQSGVADKPSNKSLQLTAGRHKIHV
jgi:hypothetical protein